MVTCSDPAFAMIKSRIENIEELQKRIHSCLCDAEIQIRQIAKHYLDYNSLSSEQLFQSPKSRVLARHHGIQWLLGQADLSDKTCIEISVKFDDINMEKNVLSKEVIDIQSYYVQALDIGMKVLAEYNPVDAPGVFYTASVAEVPEQQNRYRYLLLFDDGTAGYVIGDQCFICPDQSFISTVNPLHKRFIQYYNKMYQEGGFKILDLNKQKSIMTEVNDQWKLCHINFTDCNVANIQVSHDQTEYIYSGSPRLLPIHHQLKTDNVL